MTQYNEIIKCAERHQLHTQPQTISLNESGLDSQVAFGKDEYGIGKIRYGRVEDILKEALFKRSLLMVLQSNFFLITNTIKKKLNCLLVMLYF